MVRRLLYIGYYLKELDWHKFKEFTNYVHNTQNVSKIGLWWNTVVSALRYNISILDYFYFKFYELTNSDKETYAGTGFMYEYQLKMNPKSERSVLENKILFLKTYADFVFRAYAGIKKLKSDSNMLNKLLTNLSGKLVLKGSMGQVGEEVEMVSCTDFNDAGLIDYMEGHNYDLVEEFIIQHDVLMKLSPSGLNSIRVISQIDKNDMVVILAARLRITIDSVVDNLGAGNIAANINIETGLVDGPAVYSDITKTDVTIHPITGVDIINFKLPYWPEVIAMVKQAAYINTKNRSIGWDIAITDKGPEIIEANHNWCKLLWQLPAKKGLKSELLAYL